MADDEAVLFANEAFYRAFADRDVEAMDEVWAQGVPVACIHPGWQRARGPRRCDGKLALDPRR